MAANSADTAPYPDDSAETMARCVHTRARIRLLDGGWGRDAQIRLTARLGATRAGAVGTPDLSANPARAIWSQSAVLYDRPPLISHPLDEDGSAAAYLTTTLEQAGVWPLMQRVQRQIIGLREMFVRVDVADDGSLLVRPVTPDLVSAEPNPDRPDQPASVRELRRRRNDSGKQVWTVDVLDPALERYSVTDRRGRDLSADYLGADASGESYPYRLADGTPILPYALYHGAQTGSMFDSFDGIEIVEGTYEVSTLWAFWGHCSRDASWPQRWAIGVTVAGTSTDGNPLDVRAAVVTDPATVVMLVPLEDLKEGQQPQVGQWVAGSDPDRLADAICTYEGRLPIYAGGSPSDFTRTSGDPKSGYSLAISREGQRAAARRFEPTQRLGDQRLLTLICAALNRWSENAQGVEPLNLPETGWQVRYQAIPLSPEEQTAQRDQLTALLDRRLISRKRAYSELWGVSAEQAARELAEIDAEANAAANRSSDSAAQGGQG